MTPAFLFPELCTYSGHTFRETPCAPVGKLRLSRLPRLQQRFSTFVSAKASVYTQLVGAHQLSSLKVALVCDEPTVFCFGAPSGKGTKLRCWLLHVHVRVCRVFVTMKNGVFWDVTPCGSCRNRRISSQRASVASYS
jgi:hypothetical protein